ncbi:prolyl oligopeptidase family serine peptidase [Gammaproteobacteria bacterium]|nr:prolyl oligopeptidase family serine peptidase [Gammaproteobacteria bacterium]
MNRHHLRYLLLCLVAFLSTNGNASEPPFTRDIDLIYHKEAGYALTMDRVVPTDANGAAVVMVVSGRWISSHEFIAPQVADKLPGAMTEGILNPTVLLSRGYTVFFVVHGAEPTFTIPEIHTQISAAVRHIRHNARIYGIDPLRIGIMGGSAGGHLALLQGTKGLAADPAPSDQREQSSRVQAVMAYFPPTDFVNYGGEGGFFTEVTKATHPVRFLQALDLYDHDRDNFLRTKVTDQEKLKQHYRDISPYYHVSADDPPTLLIHGDADALVPVQQSLRIADKFSGEGVTHKLHIKPGGEHGWKPDAKELILIADWFDEHLRQDTFVEKGR